MEPMPDIVASLIRNAGRRLEPPQDAGRQVFAAAHAAFRAKAAHRRSRRRMLWAGAAAAAAAGMVLALRAMLPVTLPTVVAHVARTTGEVELAVGDSWQPLSGSQAGLPAGAQLRTRAGGGAALALASGESLRLAADTQVVLDGPGRVYLRRGTLYVDSGSRRPKPGIEILTPSGTARDLGTQFELHVAGAELRLRVREGSVAIDQGGQTLTGRAGEEVAIDGLGSVRRALIPAHDPAWQWAESLAPMPDMDGRPASALIAWVARETGRRLSYESPLVEQRAAAVILHGEVRHLAPIEALEAMLATTDLKFELHGDTMEIRARSQEPPGL